ncbi:hypothetical protein JAAARDRAFT_130657, partial [Jaapia argillacea MUCL 33604]
IKFSNLLFTSLNLVKHDNIIALEENIDPHSLVCQKMPRHLVHIHDNMVQYWEKYPTWINFPSSFRHCLPHRVHPHNFWTGQLIELEVSFATVPTQKGGHKLLCTLRSIALLDQELVTVHLISMVQPFLPDNSVSLHG